MSFLQDLLTKWKSFFPITLYKVSSQIDVAKHVQSKGFDNLLRSSSLSLNICNQYFIWNYGYVNQKYMKINTL
jgi:hypothetical protein